MDDLLEVAKSIYLAWVDEVQDSLAHDQLKRRLWGELNKREQDAWCNVAESAMAAVGRVKAMERAGKQAAEAWTAELKREAANRLVEHLDASAAWRAAGCPPGEIVAPADLVSPPNGHMKTSPVDALYLTQLSRIALAVEERNTEGRSERRPPCKNCGRTTNLKSDEKCRACGAAGTEDAR